MCNVHVCIPPSLPTDRRNRPTNSTSCVRMGERVREFYPPLKYPQRINIEKMRIYPLKLLAVTRMNNSNLREVYSTNVSKYEHKNIYSFQQKILMLNEYVSTLIKQHNSYSANSICSLIQQRHIIVSGDNVYEDRIVKSKYVFLSTAVFF